MDRRKALRKAMFESLMLTATYRVSNVIGMTGITSHNFHFVLNENTKSTILADYLNWFVVLDPAHETAGGYLPEAVSGRGTFDVPAAHGV